MDEKCLNNTKDAIVNMDANMEKGISEDDETYYQSVLTALGCSIKNVNDTRMLVGFFSSFLIFIYLKFSYLIYYLLTEIAELYPMFFRMQFKRTGLLYYVQ
jgi:hypothetical protein